MTDDKYMIKNCFFTLLVFGIVGVIIVIFCSILGSYYINNDDSCVLPGYIIDNEIIVEHSTSSDAYIFCLIPPCIDKVWWNEDIIITLNHPQMMSERGWLEQDYSISYYYLIYPWWDIILRFENEKDLEKSLSLLKVDIKEVKWRSMREARKISKEQFESKPDRLQWWLDNVEKHKFDAKQKMSDDRLFFPNIEFVQIPAGTLKRKDPLGKMMYLPDHTSERKLKLDVIEIKDEFFISKYEITQAQYNAVMGYNPAKGYGVGDNYPVYNVSWHDALEFCETLTRLARSNGKISTNQSYTLPTEQQWEYACASGVQEDLYTGNIASPNMMYESENMDKAGWYWYNQGGINYGSHEVGAKAPNSFGVYDMHGNVAEWCGGEIQVSDVCSPSYTKENLEFGGYAIAGNIRAVRGGNWHQSAYQCRTVVRYFRDSNERSPLVGFRIVLINQ
ncbi:MAG: formylglycine-generating enzyme family protein [Verrucomicrobia bacterium]|nr:formylglycine-generating enzyme family protein [Verrucomicrobiota bacterium]